MTTASPPVRSAPEGASAAPATSAPPDAAAAGQVSVVRLDEGPAPAGADTPRRLRLLSLGVVTVSLLVGIVGVLVFGYLAYALSRAEADADQLIRVQRIQTSLLSADATATNAFLVGGLEPADQRTAYDEAIAATAALIADAARHQPADSEALSALNRQVVDYAAAVEQARANNRQGFPVGAQYLRNASAQLRGSAQPLLDNLVSANAQRADDAMGVRFGYVFAGVALLGLGAVVLAQVWVARRFRRTLNVGLVGSAALLLVALLGGLIGVQRLDAQVTAIRDGSFAALNAAAGARIDANSAKSSESLTLIARGSGQSFEAAWAAAAERVAGQLDQLPGAPSAAPQWQAYTAGHAAIRALDDGGSWDKAVAQATGRGPGSSNTLFNAFDAGLADYLDQVSGSTSQALSGRQPPLIAGAIALLAAGIGAALLGRRGVAARLREYR